MRLRKTCQFDRLVFAYLQSTGWPDSARRSRISSSWVSSNGRHNNFERVSSEVPFDILRPVYRVLVLCASKNNSVGTHPVHEYCGIKPIHNARQKRF